MDTNIMDRFTPFPKISSDYDVDNNLSKITAIEWTLNRSNISLEVLVLSWATLLQAFTCDEYPIFVLNGAPIRVDLSAGVFHPVKLDFGSENDREYTALITHASLPSGETSVPGGVTQGACNLSVVLGLVNGRGFLYSTNIGPHFLEEIGRQLKQIVRKQAQSNNFDIVISQAELPRLSIANPNPRVLPGPELLHQFALKTGQLSNPAIEFLSSDGVVNSLSYEILDHLSSKLAARISAALGQSVRKSLQHNVIPVLIPQSTDLYIAWLAILKAGAAFCPLGVDSPPERIEFIIEDVAANIVVAKTSLTHKLPSSSQVKLIFTDSGEGYESSDGLGFKNPSAEDLAYVMYTSGSTGRPKGVGISHHAATQSLLAHDALIPKFKRFFQFASPTFDVSVFEVFFPLLRGATVVGSERSTTIRDLPCVLRKLQADAVELTPTVAGELLRGRDSAPSLKVLLTIGEMLTRQVVDAFGGSRDAEGILHGMYGPTETTIHCTAACNFQASRQINLIGLPLETVSAYVISHQPTSDLRPSELEVLPVGQIGELVIGGHQLADGYINRPEENSTAFLDSASYGRLYRTGDKARLLPSGEIECLGRISFGQVKLRGQRVELGEIENAVCMANDVRHAIVTVIDGVLVAFALTDGNGNTTPDELRRVCRRWLPNFMIPGDYVLLKEFPRLASGKVDRRSLELGYIQSSEVMRFHSEEPYHDIFAMRIVLCVAETLKVSVTRSQSLAAWGLDSLGAIRLASRLRTVGINLDVGEILEADSVDGIWALAKGLGTAVANEKVDPGLYDTYQMIANKSLERLVSIGLGLEFEDVDPCSHMQLAMLSESFRNPRSYCNWFELRFHDGIEISAIKRALCKIAELNDILRAGFVETGLSEYAYSRFTWKKLKEERFQETSQFDYDFVFDNENGILSPFNVQLKKENEQARALIHMHHAVYDGWSLELLLHDLDATLSGKVLAPRTRYADVSAFYMFFSRSKSAVDSNIYWQDQLQSVVPTICPNFNDSTGIPSTMGVANRVLSASLGTLNVISQRLRISRQAIFQAAFAYLLSSYCGTSDIVFGTVFSGRTLPVSGIESIIGPCIQVLPTRVNLGGVQNVSDLLKALHCINRQSLKHAALSLKDIKKASGIDPTVSLFDFLFSWQETLQMEQSAVHVFREVAASEFLEFAMTLQLEPKNNAIHAKVIYDQSALPGTQVEIFLEQIDNIVTLFMQSPDISICDIDDNISSSILSIENSRFEVQTGVPSLAFGVEKMACDDPGRIAVEFLYSTGNESGDASVRSITYYELNKRANQLAHFLLENQVADGDLVSIVLEKCVELYIAILAVIKIGAGYVPITPQTPSDRVRSILKMTESSLCITNSRVRHNIEALKTMRVVNIDHDEFNIYPDKDLLSQYNGSNVAYVIFTSGSTGKPKGVLITHHNLQSNIAVLTDIYPIQEGARMLQACSQAFDVSVFEIFFSWHSGITLCSATDNIMFRDIEQVIDVMRVSHLSLTPTVAALVNPENVPNVRFLVTSGEGMTAKVHNEWANRGLYQGYGPSETTNICTMRPNLTHRDRLRNIGKPLKNTSAFVISMSDQFSLRLRGAIGEFCFGGDQVGRGYLDLPSLTSEKFIDHPSYGRLYRSGDFGRMLADGSLVFAGRQDDQVKIRGQRVELSEINAVLLKDTDVRDCATMIIEKEIQNQQRLITFWAPRYIPEANESREAYSIVIKRLFKLLCAALPRYMIPSALIPINSIPITIMKKTNYRQLKELLWQTSLRDLQCFSAGNERDKDDGELTGVERIAAGIIADIAGVPLENVGKHTSFYVLGLDSISAIYVSKRLRESGFGQLDVSTILRHASIAQLSTILVNREPGRNIDYSFPNLKKAFDEAFLVETGSAYDATGRSVESIIPCTPLQEAMLSTRTSNVGTAYFNHLLFRIYGNIEILRATWEQMVSRHEILRTCFTTTNNAQFAYAQVILKQAALPWRRIEIFDDELCVIIEREKAYFVNLTKDTRVLPYSFCAFENKKEGNAFLLFSIHHALYDREALCQLFKEVELFYSGGQLPQAVQFSKFIEHMVNANHEESERFWKVYLSEFSPKLLHPSRRHRESGANSRYQISSFYLDIPLVVFEKKCKEISVSPLNAIHAAWARLLSLYTNSSDVCFGNVFSCRTISLDGVERLVGPCFNTLPVRVKLSSTAMNVDMMKSAQRSNVDILHYQLSSLRRILRGFNADGGPRLFDTLIILHTNSEVLDSRLWRLIKEEGDMDFPIICEITPSKEENKIQICLHSDALYISMSDMEMMAQNFVALLNHTIQYPFSQASDLGILARSIQNSMTKLDDIAKSSATTAYPPPWYTPQPQSAEERQIRDILSGLSGVKSELIKQNTTIFQLGLDSINAAQISANLKRCGYDVSTSDILEAHTVGEIALLLGQPSSKVPIDNTFDFATFDTKYRGSICEQLDISDNIIDSIRPCTSVQSGMLASFLNTNGEYYFNHMALKSSTPLDIMRLKQAWSLIVARNEILRTGFVQLNNQQYPFAMVTYCQGTIALPWYDAAGPDNHLELAGRRDLVTKNLHRPPWCLVVRDSESSTRIEFSALHAIYDIQSLQCILSEVTAAYSGQTLPEIISSNLVLAHILSSSSCEDPRVERFWKDFLEEAPIVKFPDLSPVRVDRAKLLVSTRTASKPQSVIYDGCQRMGITLQAAGQAAWSRLLSAYLGQTNVVFGITLSGRNMFHNAQMAIFPCLVTIPLCSHVKGSNCDLITSIMKSNALLIKAQFTPLQKIQQWLKFDHWLFDTLFVYQKLGLRRERGQLWEIVEEDARIDYPISIEMIPRSGQLELCLTHRSDIVPLNQAKLMLEQLDGLLMDCIFSPDSNSTDFSILSSRLLSITPAKESIIPPPVQLLHQFVEESATKFPSRTAFEFVSHVTKEHVSKKTWSYDQLNKDGNRISHLLQKFNICQGELIAICFDKCAEACLGILGILKAGCAYVALDPNAPVARKQFILTDAGSRLLLCISSKKEELNALTGIKIIVLDEPGILDGLPSESPTLDYLIQPSDICYCLYTSGTTGMPKGCEISHRNVIQALLAFRRLFHGHWDEESRWLQFASFHFDVSVLEQYWSWSVGICVTSCPRDLLFQDLAGTIRQLQITHIDLTPSLARLIHPLEVPSLCKGIFITGGEQLKQEILDAWGEYEVIYNGYGPTEVTIGCTMLPRMTVKNKSSNIGPQFDNVGSYVLEPGTSIPVLRGAAGELCVSGPLVGRGYLGRPELTEAKFQYVKEFGDRVYRTGDVVRILHDGSFQFLGRIDDQVKLRGQRVEIEEINEVIKHARPDVGEITTLVVKHPKQLKEQLVSFVTTNSPSGSKNQGPARVLFDDRLREFSSAIKLYCHSHIPSYMIPTYIIPMSSFPLSPNNKADTKVLKAIYEQLTLEDLQILASISAETLHSNQEDMNKIISILAKFNDLALGDIFPWSSIYELGMDSISVIPFARSLRDAGFASAQASVIMKNPTIASLSSALQGLPKGSKPLEVHYTEARQSLMAFSHRYLLSAVEYFKISPGLIEMISPCTPLQEGMIYRFLESQEPVYCSSFSFELKSSTDLVRLKDSWIQAQKEVQLLRVRFLPTLEGYAQVVLKSDELPWTELIAEDNAIEHLKSQNFQVWQKHISSFSSPLWKAEVIRSPRKLLMVLNMFHALYDGNSLSLLLEMVALNYFGQVGMPKAPSFLEILPLGPLCKVSGAEEFWIAHLEGSYRGKTFATQEVLDSDAISAKMEISETGSLEKLKRSLKVTEQAILQACWLIALYHHFGIVPVLGIVISGRTLDVPGAEGVIGPLFNTIPSNIQFHNLRTWSELVQACHDYHISCIPFQYTALRDIMRWTQRTLDTPLFEVLFVFQKEDRTRLVTRQIWAPVDSRSGLEYPLALEAQHDGDGSLAIRIATNSRDFPPEVAQRLADTFRTTLSELIQDPSRVLPSSDTPGSKAGPTEEMRRCDLCIERPRVTSKWTIEACRIRDAVAELGRVEPECIDLSTSIFELGLDSIDAIRLSSKLFKSGINISVSTIVRQRTIQKMAEKLETTTKPPGESPILRLVRYERDLTEVLRRERTYPEDAIRVFPPTPLQEAMVAEMIASNYRHYYNHDILELEDEVELAQILRAWETVISAHPILRTSFVEVEDPNVPFTYVQVVHRAREANLSITDLKGKSIHVFLEDQKQKQTSTRPNRPELRICAVISGQKRYILLSIAHALYDGWSLELLHGDVARCFSGESCIRPSYEDFLAQMISSFDDQSMNFWQALLANYNPAQFPPGPNAGSDECLIHREVKSIGINHDEIKSFCKKHGITIQALAVTCWSLVLAGYLGKLDVVFGLVFSGRSFPDANEIMFPTMNTVAMRSIIHGSLLGMAQYVQDTLSNITEFHNFPLRKASRRLFDTIFIYQGRPTEILYKRKQLYKSVCSSSEVEYPISVEIEAVGESLVSRVACRDNVLGIADTISLLKRIDAVFCRVIREPNHATIDFVNNGISICGCPVFQNPEISVAEPSNDESAVVDESRWLELEARIRGILSIVSKVPETRISKDTTLFHLGLDSISAIKVASLLRKGSITLPVSEMLKAGSIRGIAHAVQANHLRIQSVDVDTELSNMLRGFDVATVLKSQSIKLEEIEKVFPTTAGQTYLLAMNLLNPSVFYPSFSYATSASLTREQLNDAWASLLQKVPLLRTTFIPTGQSQLPFIQVVLKHVENPVNWHESTTDKDSWGVSGRKTGLVPVSLHACQPPNGTLIMLQIHHALYDAVSLPRLVDALAKFCIDKDIEIIPKPGLPEFVAFQGVHSPLTTRRTFWEGYLGQIDCAQIPDSEVVPWGKIHKHYRPRLIDDISEIEKIANSQGLSVQALFLAIYARVHLKLIRKDATSSAFGSDRLVVGVYLANRGHVLEGLPSLVAPTLNIVPLIVDNTRDNGSIFKTSQAVQNDLQSISMVEHSGVSLIEIADWTGVRLDVCINLLQLPELDSMDDSTVEQRVQFLPINLEQPTRFSGTIHGNDDSFNASNTNSDMTDHHLRQQVIWSPTESNDTSFEFLPRDVFKPSIDIEAAIRGGALDVGIFAPMDLLDDHTAQHVLLSIQEEMGKLVIQNGIKYGSTNPTH